MDGIRMSMMRPPVDVISVDITELLYVSCRALLLIGFGRQFDSYRKGDLKKVLKVGEIEKFERQINRISLHIEL